MRQRRRRLRPRRRRTRRFFRMWHLLPPVSICMFFGGISNALPAFVAAHWKCGFFVLCASLHALSYRDLGGRKMPCQRIFAEKCDAIVLFDESGGWCCCR
uniref:Uncharacterized protein n=1 Tax=Arundo donax TaxID=35708 RepID=A0A0A9CIE3_ARUDO